MAGQVVKQGKPKVSDILRLMPSTPLRGEPAAMGQWPYVTDLPLPSDVPVGTPTMPNAALQGVNGGYLPSGLNLAQDEALLESPIMGGGEPATDFGGIVDPAGFLSSLASVLPLPESVPNAAIPADIANPYQEYLREAAAIPKARLMELQDTRGITAPQPIPHPVYDDSGLRQRRGQALDAAGIATLIGALTGNAGYGAQAGAAIGSGMGEAAKRDVDRKYVTDTDLWQAESEAARRLFSERMQIISAYNDAATSNNKAAIAERQDALDSAVKRYGIRSNEAYRLEDMRRKEREALAEDERKREELRVKKEIEDEKRAVERWKVTTNANSAALRSLIATTNIMTPASQAAVARILSEQFGGDNPIPDDLFLDMKPSDRDRIKAMVDIAKMNNKGRVTAAGIAAAARTQAAQIAQAGANARANARNYLDAQIKSLSRSSAGTTDRATLDIADSLYKSARDAEDSIKSARKQIADADKVIAGVHDPKKGFYDPNAKGDPDNPLTAGINAQGLDIVRRQMQRQDELNNLIRIKEGDHTEYVRKASEIVTGVLDRVQSRNAQGAQAQPVIIPLPVGDPRLGAGFPVDPRGTVTPPAADKKGAGKGAGQGGKGGAKVTGKDDDAAFKAWQKSTESVIDRMSKIGGK